MSEWLTAISIIGTFLALLTAIFTAYIALKTYHVAKQSTQVAVESKAVAIESMAVAKQSMDVAIESKESAARLGEMSYNIASKSLAVSKQVGREASWALVKVSDTRWVLERLHDEPAILVKAEVDHPVAPQIEFRVPGKKPNRIFRRGDKIELGLWAPKPNCHLIIHYRELDEDAPKPDLETSYVVPGLGQAKIEARLQGAILWKELLA